MTAYLLAHRLSKVWGAPTFSPTSTTPFEDPSDYRTMRNDWPYDFPPNISQMVVWTKTTIPIDSDIGDMTPASRAIIAAFAERYFTNRLPAGARNNVMWFENWGDLRSISEIDHVHVIVRDVDHSIIEEWTEERECHQI